MELVENAGTGLLRINQNMGEYKLPPPVIRADKHFFSIIFERPKTSYEERIYGNKRRLGEKLGENQRRIVAAINKNKNITTEELSEAIGISNTAIENNIRKLKLKGILKRIGPDKGGHWEVIQ